MHIWLSVDIVYDHTGCAQSQLEVEPNEAYACSLRLKVNTAYENRVLGTAATVTSLGSPKDQPMELEVNDAYEQVSREKGHVIYEEPI